MITVTTQFKLSKAGRKAALPDRPSDLLTRINPNDCYQITGIGIPAGSFKWIDVYNDHSPLNPAAYVKDVLQRRRQFLAINHQPGKLFELVSCQIEIDNLSFACRLVEGKWVS